MIPIEIEGVAASEEFNLDLGWTSCGLFWTDQNRCPHPPMKARQICGNVTDVTGASIPNAEVRLSRANDKSNTMPEIRYGQGGDFSVPDLADGTYELFVRAPGFSPLRTTVQVRADRAASCAAPLRIELGVSGACSGIR
jgi:hypothetical protein